MTASRPPRQSGDDHDGEEQLEQLRLESRFFDVQLRRELIRFWAEVVLAVTALGSGVFSLVSFTISGELQAPAKVMTGVAGASIGVLALLAVERSRLATVGLAKLLRRTAPEEREHEEQRAALSLAYLDAVRKRVQLSQMVLLAAAGAPLLADAVRPSLSLSTLALIPLGGLGLLLIKQSVLSLRIERGLFGSTRHEARELLAFIAENADTIDFGDGQGGLREALVPERREDARAGMANVPARGRP